MNCEKLSRVASSKSDWEMCLYRIHEIVTPKKIKQMHPNEMVKYNDNSSKTWNLFLEMALKTIDEYYMVLVSVYWGFDFFGTF